MIYLVSACLIGINCRYDGANSYSETIAAFLSDRHFVSVCPELLGGLGVPRAACRFEGGDGRAVFAGTARILAEYGIDLTESFILGAREAFSIARQKGVNAAILKERSPSCGVREVYVGTDRVPGMGVMTALLVGAGIRVISNEEPIA